MNRQWHQIGNSWFLYTLSQTYPRQENWHCVGEIHYRKPYSGLGKAEYYAYGWNNPHASETQLISSFVSLDDAKAAVVSCL